MSTTIILQNSKKPELIQNRLGVLAAAEPYVGTYFSVDYLRRHVLKQTDYEITEIDERIAFEKRDGYHPWCRRNGR